MIYFRGNPNAKIVLVTDVLSKEELEAAEPLVGNTGKLYDAIVDNIGIDRNDVVYVNGITLPREQVVRCSKEELYNDVKENLFPYLNKVERKVVVLLGKRMAEAARLIKGNGSLSSVREKINTLNGVDAPVVASVHPYFLSVDPQVKGEILADFRLINRILNDDVKAQVPIKIVKWERPSDVLAFADRVRNKEFQSISYDNETTGLDSLKDDVWCTAFHAGEVDENGHRIAYKWTGYDRLVPLYSKDEIEEFKDAFAVLFDTIASSGCVEQRGWHIDFDDEIEDTWLSGRTVVRSKRDGMVMSWVVDNTTPNKLKQNVYRYLGYAKYDEAIEAEFNAIKSRRARVLTEPDDIEVLRRLGVEPDVNERTGSKKWPKSVDKGAYGYALIDKDILGHYCCLDAVYTHMLCDVFAEIIERDGLGYACEFRHVVLDQLYWSKKTGMYVDKEKVAKVRRQLEAIKQSSMEEFYKAIGKDINLNAPIQVGKALFGEPEMIPAYDGQGLYTEYKASDVNKIIQALTTAVYGDYKAVQESIKDGSFDYKTASQKMVALFDKYYPDLKGRMYTTPIPMYCKGMFKPSLFTKTGLPSVSRVALEVLFENSTDNKNIETLKLYLMNRKATKLISTFIDGIVNKLDDKGILRPRGNAIGTNTGRASVAKPNTQNWPPSIRGIVVPRGAGRKFVTWDLSQAEVRVIAALSNDKALIEVLSGDGDIHYNVASVIFNKPVAEISSFERKVAKAQPLYSKIATPYGWTTMGDLKEGSYVMSSDGESCKVTGVFPQGKKEIWKVYFKDGQFVECAGDHLWSVIDRTCAKYKTVTLTTEELSKNIFKNRGYRYAVTRTKPVKYANNHIQLPIGPYTLGVLLGDGSIQHSNFCTIDAEIADLVKRESCNYGWDVTESNSEGRLRIFRLSKKDNNPRTSVYRVLREYSNTGKWRSWEKFIPEPYLRATVEDRWALLRGLMDTDGTASKSHNYSFCSVSERLANDVVELARSLGCYARIGGYEVRKHRKYYRVHISSRECLFSLSRKVNRWVPNRTDCTSITKIEKTGIMEEMQCITVDNPTHLYLTDGFIPTHNTIVFGIIYGMSAKSLAVKIGVSVEEAERIIQDKFFRAFPDMKQWLDDQRIIAARPPYYVHTPIGTRRSTINILSTDQETRGHIERVATNMPIQGGAGELTFYYMDKIRERCKEFDWFQDTYMVNTTHDSASYEVPSIKEAELLVEISKQVVDEKVSIPPLDRVKFKMDVEITDSWYGEPSVYKAVDPSEEYFNWSLIKLDNYLDEEEAKEIMELAL